VLHHAELLKSKAEQPKFTLIDEALGQQLSPKQLQVSVNPQDREGREARV
jgi:hypothetical protein